MKGTSPGRREARDQKAVRPQPVRARAVQIRTGRDEFVTAAVWLEPKNHHNETAGKVLLSPPATSANGDRIWHINCNTPLANHFRTRDVMLFW
jgi:hypothetical protein